MLIADPSSACDICFEKFSSNRECWSIPCGHVFCHDCLGRLTQPVCPMCRTPLGRGMGLNSNPWLVRKVHVDMSKCEGKNSTAEGPEAQNTRRLRKLEKKIASQTLDGRELTVMRATELAEEINDFLRRQSPNEYALLKTIETLLTQLSFCMARLYEDNSLSKAVKSSYEHRIRELEQSLRQQTRTLSGNGLNSRIRDSGRETKLPPHTSVARDLYPSKVLNREYNYKS